MAQVKRIEYGSNDISLFAEKGSFDLVIGGFGTLASAKTRREMYEKIERIMDDLRDIRWELDRDYGVFGSFKDEADESEEMQESA